MSIRLNVINATEGENINVELEENDSIGDVIVFASQYWDKSTAAFVMKRNNRLLPSHESVGELGLKNGDTVILVPDPQGG